MNFKRIYKDTYGSSPHKSVIFRADGSVERSVQNLGWLLRHWQEVKSFEIERWWGEKMWDAIMVAHLSDGGAYATGAYVTTWADASVLREWLHRPVFRGVPLNWFGHRTKC